MTDYHGDYQGEQQTTEAHVPHAPKGHEQSDVALRPLVIIAALLVLVAIVTHVGLWLAMVYFERDERRDESPASPVLDAGAVPPEPRLQPTVRYHPTLPAQDMRTLNEQTRAILSTPGWVDRERGIVRIPIDVAMQLVLQGRQPGGGPTTAPATAPNTQGGNR